MWSFTVLHVMLMSISISECKIDLSLLELPEEISCHIPDYCTGIECCVFVGLIRRSFQVQVLLDGCSNKVTVAIEKLRRTKVFRNYDYGKI